MSYIVQFFVTMMRMLGMVTGFLLSIPGLIVSSITGVASACLTLYHDVGNCCQLVYDFLHTAVGGVQSLMTYLSSVSYFNFFYRLFALDVFGQVFSSFITLFLIVLFFAAFQIFFQAVIIAVPFFTYKAISKIVQAASMGFAKVS